MVIFFLLYFLTPFKLIIRGAQDRLYFPSGTVSLSVFDKGKLQDVCPFLQL